MQRPPPNCPSTCNQSAQPHTGSNTMLHIEISPGKVDHYFILEIWQHMQFVTQDINNTNTTTQVDEVVST